jgi:hypothetical protein
VNDWEEVRVKGEFTNFARDSQVDPHASLKSRFIYEVTVKDKPQRVLIGVH